MDLLQAVFCTRIHPCLRLEEDLVGEAGQHELDAGRKIYGCIVLFYPISDPDPTWGPTRISLVKLSSANQMMGEMSTPPTGGIKRRVGPSTGSVGATATLHGNFFAFSCCKG